MMYCLSSNDHSKFITRIGFILLIINIIQGHQIFNKPDGPPARPHKLEDDTFSLPAPGLRYPKSKPSVIRRRQILAQPADQIVGNLLPEDPNKKASEVMSLDVACSKEQMTTRIVFDKKFDGIIYSKGHYDNPLCHHVKAKTGKKDFIFAIVPGRCGTQFVSAPGGTPYLENILVIQNTPGIQEASDTARGIRCVFDGSEGKKQSTKTVSANLNVAQMQHKFATYTADTTDTSEASATLDIQVGKGPFGPTASGLVRIGEMMTMVVSVEGAKEADILVRKCSAHDGTQNNEIQLTDQHGCVMKKEILGSWQKTTKTGTPNMPVMAYAHFQAFKFPDKLDVFIECEVELCTKECTVCPEDQSSNKRTRGKRALPPTHKDDEDSLGDIQKANVTDTTNDINNRFQRKNGLKLAKRLRVLSPEDLATNNEDISAITLVTQRSGDNGQEVCLSLSSFISGMIAMLFILVLSSVITAILCIRVRTMPANSSTYLPDSSFHAFSSVAGKTL